jgi:quercetin dioxygenase-like cupin family protein
VAAKAMIKPPLRSLRLAPRFAQESQREMMEMSMQAAGIVRNEESENGIVWQILGQTYAPKKKAENAFSWHATFPGGTFVPPHYHTTQDEHIFILEGEMTLRLADEEIKVRPGDLSWLPKNVPHGFFNQTDSPVKCLFWVTPGGKLFDLFQAINNLEDPNRIIAISREHEVEFLPAE